MLWTIEGLHGTFLMTRRNVARALRLLLFSAPWVVLLVVALLWVIPAGGMSLLNSGWGFLMSGDLKYEGQAMRDWREFIFDNLVVWPARVIWLGKEGLGDW